MKQIVSVCFAFILALVVLIQPAIAQTNSSSAATTPDLDHTTFNGLPRISEGAMAILEDRGIIDQLGYNPNRSWRAGASVTNVLKLGDFYENGLGEVSVAGFISGTNFEQVPLGAFKALNTLTLADLVKAVPQLNQLPVSSVPIAKALLTRQWTGMPTQALNFAPQTDAQIKSILQNPALADLPLEQIVQGDWQGALSQNTQAELNQLVKAYPQLANIQLDQLAQSGLLSGDFQGTLNAKLSQGLNRLVKEYPQLKGVPSREIVEALTTGDPQGMLKMGLKKGSSYVIGELAKQFPELSKVPLGTIFRLDQFSLASVPGLAQTPIKQVPRVANQSLNSVAGAGNVAISRALSVAQPLLMNLAQVDFLDQAAGKADYPLSGSTRDDVFVPEPCDGAEQDCSHFEVANPTLPGLFLNGRQWVIGKQKVKGGKGPLALVNGGKEPTGLVPWGFRPNLKLVASKVIDAEGKVDMSLYMRVCKTLPFIGETCTPYFIGPIPFGSVSEGGRVLISSSLPPPTVQFPPGFEGLLGGEAGDFGAAPCDGNFRGVDIGSIKSAIGHVESHGSGSYAAIGSYVCDGHGNCGRALGKYQFMTYGPVKGIILKKPGGAGFLARANVNNNSGFYKASLSKQVEQYFTVTEQEAMMSQHLKGLIAKAQGQGYKGAALVGRVAEMHNAGEFSRPGAATRYAIAVIGGYKQVAGKLAGQCQVASCPPGKPCKLLNPNKRGVILTAMNLFGAPRRRRNGIHFGVDLFSPAARSNRNGPGDPILSPADGVVIEHVPVGGKCGGIVRINHPGFAVATRHLHMIQTFVRYNQSVKRGQQIGVEGNEKPGCSSGAHLHLEVYPKGSGPQNPVTFIWDPPMPTKPLY